MYNIDKTVWRQLGWVIISANTSIFQWQALKVLLHEYKITFVIKN